jgi:hypothetical protein
MGECSLYLGLDRQGLSSSDIQGHFTAILASDVIASSTLTMCLKGMQSTADKKLDPKLERPILPIK